MRIIAIVLFTLWKLIKSQECDGFFNDKESDNNVCCDTRCINPNTNQQQCGGIGCSNFFNHLYQNGEMSELEAIDEAQNSCCINEIRWDNQDGTICANVSNKAPCLTTKDVLTPTNRFRAIGDPHFLTPEGTHYHFQGKGVYWLLRSNYLNVQVNMFNLDKNQMGTFIGQVALKFADNNIISFIPKLDGSTITVYQTNLTNTSLWDEVSLRQYNNNIYYLKYVYGIQMFISFTKIQGYWVGEVDVLLDKDTYYQHNVSGLIGLWNGQKQDFTMPNNVLAKDEIQFGESWKVTSSDEYFDGIETSSLFKGSTVKFDINKVDSVDLIIGKRACDHLEKFIYIDCVIDYVTVGREILNLPSYMCNCDYGICESNTSQCICYEEYEGYDCSILKQDEEDWYEKWWVWVIIGGVIVFIICLCFLKYRNDPNRE